MLIYISSSECITVSTAVHSRSRNSAFPANSSQEEINPAAPKNLKLLGFLKKKFFKYYLFEFVSLISVPSSFMTVQAPKEITHLQIYFCCKTESVPWFCSVLILNSPANQANMHFLTCTVFFGQLENNCIFSRWGSRNHFLKIYFAL